MIRAMTATAITKRNWLLTRDSYNCGLLGTIVDGSGPSRSTPVDLAQQCGGAKLSSLDFTARPWKLRNRVGTSQSKPTSR